MDSLINGVNLTVNTLLRLCCTFFKQNNFLIISIIYRPSFPIKYVSQKRASKDSQRFLIVYNSSVSLLYRWIPAVNPSM